MTADDRTSRWHAPDSGTPSPPSTSSSRSWTAEGCAASSSSSGKTRPPAGRCPAASSITARRSKRPPSARPARRPRSTSSSSASSAPTRTPHGTRASTRYRRSSWPGPREIPEAPTTPGRPSSSIPATGAALSRSTTGRSSTIISHPGKGPPHVRKRRPPSETTGSRDE
jgi:hypothetical protein